jgi:hypothetical protein
MILEVEVRWTAANDTSRQGSKSLQAWAQELGLPLKLSIMRSHTPAESNTISKQ